MTRGLNKVMIIGQLGRDPEMRYTPNGRPVTAFSIAVSRSWTAGWSAPSVTLISGAPIASSGSTTPVWRPMRSGRRSTPGRNTSTYATRPNSTGAERVQFKTDARNET